MLNWHVLSTRALTMARTYHNSLPQHHKSAIGIDDLAQDALVRAYEATEQNLSDSALSHAYLIRVMRNTLQNQLRYYKARKRNYIRA